MSLRNIFELDASTVESARRCYNLVFTAVVYLITVLILIFLAVGFGAVVGQLAIVMGLDDKTRQLISYTGISVFVILIVTSFGLALGDAIRLIRYYIRDWSSSDETHQSSREADQN